MDGKSTTIVPIKEEVEEVNEQIASNEEEEEDIEALAEPPDWLPDGWIMEVYREEDGTIHRVYLISNIRLYYICDSVNKNILWIILSLATNFSALDLFSSFSNISNAVLHFSYIGLYIQHEVRGAGVPFFSSR